MAELVKTLNGLAWASVKTRDGLAVASIKNINGVDTTGGGGGGIAFVLSTVKAGAETGATTDAVDTTGADFLVAAVSYFTSGSGMTMSDSKGNTWNALTTSTISFTVTRLYWCVPSSVGSGHTFTFSGTGVYPSLAVMAFSGADSTPLDQQNGATASSVTSLSTGSITPSVNGCVLFTGIGFENTFSSPSINESFTGIVSASYNSGTHFGLAAAYRIQATAAAINPQWSWTGSATVAARIASFTPA
jgi:hypothetical protein